MAEHTPGLDELHSLVVRLHGMLTDRQPGLISWRLTVSEFCVAIGDFAGIGKVSAMPELLEACKEAKKQLRFYGRTSIKDHDKELLEKLTTAIKLAEPEGK